LGRPLPAVAVSTPGKLILMGEHAVVYGRPALVAAIDLRLRATFSSPAIPATPATATTAANATQPATPAIAATPPTLATPATPATPAIVEIDLPGLAHVARCTWDEVLAYARRARDGWTAYAAQPAVAGFLALRGQDPAHIVKVALGEVAAALGEEPASAPALHLRLDSALPIGAGFGSSAAAAVAIVAGYAVWRGGGGDADRAAGWLAGLDAAAIERLALEAERRQHGLPSGVDTATSLHGGLLWAERLPAGELRREQLATGSPLLSQLRVFHTGMPPEATGEVVAAVRARRDREPQRHERLFDRMAAAALGLRQEIERAAPDPDQVTALIRENEECLEELGVVPAAVRNLVRQVEAAGGAAKVSGAGSLAGPGGGSLLVYHRDAEAIADWQFLRRLTAYPVHLGTAGFRQDSA
jgi:mevalonate kinase